MEKIYRKDYTGEFVVYKINLKNGKISENREWIPDTIGIQPHTGHAIIIGNGTSRKSLDLSFIGNHRGGHLGKKKLSSYGCNGLYRDFAPNYLVATGKKITDEIAESGYAKKHIVLTHPEHILAHVGNFHLIPFDRHWNAGAIATWLACFDGHKKIYLTGFDNQVGPTPNRNIYANTNGYDHETANVNDAQWIQTMFEIFTTYDDVEFIWVNSIVVPELWRNATNLRFIDIRGLVIEADLGA